MQTITSRKLYGKLNSFMGTMHIPPVLSTIARRGLFAAPTEITSFFPKCHKDLAMVFFIRRS